MNHIVVALSVEAAGLFAITGALVTWTRSVLRTSR